MDRDSRTGAGQLSAPARRVLLAIARNSVEAAVLDKPPPEPHPKDLPAALFEPGACFVTVYVGGELRGCLGHLEPRLPLWRAAVENATNAAQQDPRFEPISRGELSNLGIQVSVLTPAQPLSFSSAQDLLSRLWPGRDGVILEIGEDRSTFLPQVWATLPDPEVFLDHLADKACGRKSAWRDPLARVWVYETQSFGDTT